MKFDTEICNGVSCHECSFNKGEDGCLLAKRLDEIEITTEPCEDVVPSAQPEPRWVPCSERCPVKEGRYLATMHPTYSHDIDIEIVCWSGRWSRWVGYDEREILAWMPLPEMYKEGEG